jgi:deoxycytidylate deaminase
MTNRTSWDETWLALAHGIAKRSLCSRDKVGAVIVSVDNTPLMSSYNGPPSGFLHNDQPCTSWCSRASGDNKTWVHDGMSGPPHEIQYTSDGAFWRSMHPMAEWKPFDEATRKALGYVETPVLSPNYEDCPALHAEANALSRSNHMHRAGGTIYVTSDVCFSCAKLIANSGIKHVVVDRRIPREYRNSAKSYEFLTIACGLTVSLVTEHALPADYGSSH